MSHRAESRTRGGNHDGGRNECRSDGFVVCSPGANGFGEKNLILRKILPASEGSGTKNLFFLF